MARSVAIVPHTHWDREWYQPFQSFRLRLVSVLDDLLDTMEADLSYARFLLDGQMAVVDDYLAVRPEAEERLRRLAAAGRLTMGPWYILMDEFLVSGETIVRNLQKGLQRAAAFGGAMPVGYLPDMFGHIAQMPQLLRQAGIEHAVVWRGVPSAVDRTGFWWVAPDGSRVRAEYLVTGYGNGAGVPEDAKGLVRRLSAYEAEVGDFLLDGLLYMNGNDHQPPQPWLGRVVAEVNDMQDDLVLQVTSLPEYLATAPVEGLASWRGELRSGARANLLMGVASNRVDVKQAAARAERALERLAEPLTALFVPPDRWPGSLLDMAWTDMIRNSAHDSICACSVDEVCVAVVHRYAEARQIAEGLTESALRWFAATMQQPGPVVLNPSARPRAGLVEVVLPGSGPVEGGQVLYERPALLGDLRLTAGELGALFGAIRSQQLDESTFINAIDVTEDESGLELVIHADERLRTNLVIEDVKDDVRRRIEGRPELPVHLRIEQPPRRRVLLRAGPVAGYGWTTLPTVGPLPAPDHPVRTEGGNALANGLVRVEVDPEDGTFAVDGLAGFGRLVDGGDQGDTYNYSPPRHDAVVDRPDSVTVRVLEEGPIRARLAVTGVYRWPERVDDAERSRVGARDVEVETTLELRAGERLVRVETRFDNPCRDHRLRAVFPLPVPATTSHAECAFAVVERGLHAEGGPNERPLATYPSRRFVHAGGVTVFHEGLLEYELVAVDGGPVSDGPAPALALTLLRATGMLSRVEMTNRPLPAGPPIRMRGPQLIGPVDVRYALLVDREPARDRNRLYEAADDAFLPLMVATAPGGSVRPPHGSALTVEGAVVSALRRVEGHLELRVFNPAEAPATVTVAGRTGWLVDLRGRPVEPFHGSTRLGPWAVATLLLTGD